MSSSAAAAALTERLVSACDASDCGASAAAAVLRSLAHDRGGGNEQRQRGSGGRLLALAAGLLAAAAAITCGAPAAVARYVTSQRCIVSNNVALLELSRPAFDCDACARLNGSVPTVDAAAAVAAADDGEFVRRHAYAGVPLLVRGGAGGWSALQQFSFDYFRRLYVDTPGALASVDRECQFFPYQTEFRSLADVFNMSDERRRLEPGQPQWYVGWSNCHPKIKEELRKHYSRPTFLPKDSDASSQDWIFMGGFGGGAYLHIDYVRRPSWQAMIAGSKTWTLVPSPECSRFCPPMNVTMETGDILIVDTNMWYHKTYIHPGQLSITIGSEYD